MIFSFLQERQDLQRIEKDRIAGKRPTVCVRVHGSARVCPHMHAHGSARVCPCMHAHVHAIVGLSASACALCRGRGEKHLDCSHASIFIPLPHYSNLLLLLIIE